MVNRTKAIEGDEFFGTATLTDRDMSPARLPWVDEMARGYLDGRNFSNAEPSEDCSHSYRHGFENGRDAKAAWSRGTASEIRAWAEKAIDLDVERAGLHPEGTAPLN